MGKGLFHLAVCTESPASMEPPRFIQELRQTLVLAAPIAAGHVSQMLLGVVDTLMIGRVGVVELAASALALTIIHFIFVMGIGLLSSVSVLVSHAYGAGNLREAGELLRRGLAIALGSGLLMFVLIWSAFPLLGYLGQPEEVVVACKPYLWLLASSLPFMNVIICLRNYTEAQNIPWPAFWTGLASVLLNVFLNWVLIYGNLGAPALGLPGAGVATVIARAFNVAVAGAWPVSWFAAIPWRSLLEPLRLGFPIGLQILLEVGVFGMATIMMGWLGVVPMASHQIAITCAATTFMVPLGLSQALTIRVGHVLGAGQAQRARRVAFGGLGFGIAWGGLFAVLFIAFSREIAGFFTQDPETLSLAASLLVIAGLFQIFDGSQVVGAGALRGCKDVRIPTWIMLVAYWLVALPVAAGLAFLLDWGARGVWTGLAAGLAVAAVSLAGRFLRVTRTYLP